MRKLPLGLVHGVSDEALDPLQSIQESIDAALLRMQYLAQLFYESLQVTVANLDFGQAAVVHGGSLADGTRGSPPMVMRSCIGAAIGNLWGLLARLALVQRCRVQEIPRLASGSAAFGLSMTVEWFPYRPWLNRAPANAC